MITASIIVLGIVDIILLGIAAYTVLNKNKSVKKKKISLNTPGHVIQQNVINFHKKHGGANVYSRQMCQTCHELDIFEKTTPLSKKPYISKVPISCYGCGKVTNKLHPVYIYSCPECGAKFQKFRNLTTDLSKYVSIVVGCRTKLGHQVCLKLLRAGSIVVGTTRYPEDTYNLFKNYEDSEKFINRLDLYEKGLDLDTEDQETVFQELRDYIQQKYGRLDALVFCAAQTIRVREKDRDRVRLEIKEQNRYGDAKFVHNHNVNSWAMLLRDIEQQEMEECMRINAVAPAVMVKTMLPIMKLSKVTPYIISVHAREGNFMPVKSANHMHTNLAKAALSMMTKVLCADPQLVTDSGKKFSVHGCDPGWISVDEYYEDRRPWIVPPLDEVDGAARILYPLFAHLPSCEMTRKHYDKLLY